MKRLFLILLMSAILPSLVGCVGSETFSNVARDGDTVAVAIGEAHDADFINAADVSATLVDVNGASFPVKVKTVFRVYADPLSVAVTGVPGNSPSYEGQWMALIDLVDSNGDPIAAAPGDATLQLSHPTLALYDPTLKILPGTGSPHPLTDKNGDVVYSFLHAGPHVAVQTSGTSSVAVAGVTFVVDFDTTKISNGGSVRVLKMSQDPNVQLSFSKQDKGNGLLEYKVILLNPHGFDAADGNLADFRDGKSLLKDLSFVLTWENQNTTLPSTASDITLVSANYIDVNGDPITSGLTASFGGGYGYTN